MRVTIIAEDNRVNVEGFSEYVDCSALPDDIHVIQWYGKFGEVEFITDLATGKRKPNERIHSFAPYQSLLDEWEEMAKTNVA